MGRNEFQLPWKLIVQYGPMSGHSGAKVRCGSKVFSTSGAIRPEADGDGLGATQLPHSTGVALE